jgi:mannose-1-phosphate guanylyltransferase
MNRDPDAALARAPDDLWAIVLAGSEGTRLAPVTRLLYGCEVPKQFAFLGDGSLLQRTMDRIAPIVPTHRTVVVVAQNRRQIAETQPDLRAALHSMTPVAS